jgi:hypothetical protein
MAWNSQRVHVVGETYSPASPAKQSAGSGGLGWFLAGSLLTVLGGIAIRHLKGNVRHEHTNQKFLEEEIRYQRVRLDNGLERLAKIEGYLTPPPSLPSDPSST